MELSDVVIIVLEAAERPINLYELAYACEPYMDRFVSHFEVKQVCMSLFSERNHRIEVR